MLGTKGIWKRKEPEKILSKYKSLIDYYNLTLKRNVQLFGDISDLDFKLTAFSDTIILTCSVKEEDKGKLTDAELVSVGTYNLHFLLSAAIVAENYPRGAISLGRFHRLDSMIVGPAIDEAAEYYRLPNWVGISAAPSLHYFLSNHPGKPLDPRKYFVKWDISLNNGVEKDAWALNWPNKARYNNSKNLETNFQKIQEIITAEMQTTDVAVAMKWRNTDAFFKANNH